MSIKQKLWYKLYIKIIFRFYTKSNIKIKTKVFLLNFLLFLNTYSFKIV